jgi:hypothetical protein
MSAASSSTLRLALRDLRRPIALTIVSAICLALQHVLLRKMAHGHVAHVLLAAGNHPPPSGAATLAIALLVARFVAYVLVPGLLLAAGAETIAFFLVGPRSHGQGPDRDDEEGVEPTGEP